MLKNGKLINPEIRIENTNMCNAHCVMCAHDQMTRRLGMMKNRFFKDLVQQGKDLGAELITVFGFGEPFLDPSLIDKIQMCTDLGLKTFVTTNGSLCNWQTMYDIFLAGLTHIRFSVHGTDAESYEKAQPPFKFSNIMTRIFSAIELKNAFFPDRELSITAMPSPGESVEDYKFWNLTGITWLEIWRPHNWGTKKTYRKKSPKIRTTCFRPFTGPVQVQWDGTVIPCCFLTDGEIILGNAHKHTLVEILEGEAYRELRKRHETGDLKGLPCEDCDQRFIEDESPLLYSNRDFDKNLNTTSSLKFKLEENYNGRNTY